MNEEKRSFSLDTISKFATRKGFVYQGSGIYGGLANTWDYGPMGSLLKNNLKNEWRKHFVIERNDMVEIDAGIFMNPKVWEASGHTAGFSDCMIDDKISKHRFRADHLIESQLGVDVEGWSVEEITKLIHEKKLKNPITGKEGEWTNARYMNLMFETNRDKINQNPEQKIYLRPETAQGIFVNFKNVMQTERRKLPFGIAQIGKAFRNEITPGNFTFRIVEFEQMEIEYFINPKSDWNKYFEELLAYQKEFLIKKLGFSEENLIFKEHAKEKLSHYSKRTVDIEYKYPFGISELWGLAYRTDFDLSQHEQHSKQDLKYLDPATNEKFLPHVLEPSVGVDRLFLATLLEHYDEEKVGENDVRIVVRFPKNIAPYKFAILPLMKKEGMDQKAQEIVQKLKEKGLSVIYDEAGSIGKRYRRQDENGTPKCITVDFDTLKDETVTIRDRDSMEQTRVKIVDLLKNIDNYL